MRKFFQPLKIKNPNSKRQCGEDSNRNPHSFGRCPLDNYRTLSGQSFVSDVAGCVRRVIEYREQYLCLAPVDDGREVDEIKCADKLDQGQERGNNTIGAD